jgi:hypothetical protein
MDAAEFWDEARRRRNQFFLVSVGWLIAGPLLLGFYTLILPAKAPVVIAGFAALFTWGAFWSWIAWRIRQLGVFAAVSRHSPILISS